MMRDYILTSDNTNKKEESEENVKSNKNVIDSKNIDIKVVNNHIYFYDHNLFTC